MRIDARRLLVLLLLAHAAVHLERAIVRGTTPCPPSPDAERLRVRLDPNRAGEGELLLLDGLGPSRVRALLEMRRGNPFHGVEDLLSVPGIGPATLERLRADLEERLPVVRPP